MTSAPIILVPGFWLGAWAWDEVAAMLRADGHDVTALTLPGLESADADRSSITFDDHVDAIVDAVEAAAAPVVLAVHSATGFSGYAASDRVPDGSRRWSTSTPRRAIAPLDPGFEDVEKPMVWSEIEAEENLDGLSDEQKADVPRAGRPGAGRRPPRGSAELTNDARRDIPSTLIATGFTAEDYQKYAHGAPRVVVPRRHPRAAQRDLDRPADQPLADVVAAGRHRPDHRRRRRRRGERAMTGTAAATTDGIGGNAFEAAEGTADWRVVGDGAIRVLRDRFVRAERAVRRRRSRDLPGIADHAPDVDVRAGGVTVRLLTYADDWYGMSQRDLDAARRISAVAREQGLAADTSAVASFLVVPGALSTAEVLPFWQAVLGYEPRRDSPRGGPRRPARSPARASGSRRMDEPRGDGGGAIHVAIWVPHELAEARVKAALAAGGRLVRDQLAPPGGRSPTRPATRRHRDDQAARLRARRRRVAACRSSAARRLPQPSRPAGSHLR